MNLKSAQMLADCIRLANEVFGREVEICIQSNGFWQMYLHTVDGDTKCDQSITAPNAETMIKALQSIKPIVMMK